MTRKTAKDDHVEIDPSIPLSATSGECMRALKKLEQLMIGGLRHGFFECTVVCEVINGQKRRLVIKAGESHRFIIPMEEIEHLA
jgi:hypothetical protein